MNEIERLKNIILTNQAILGAFFLRLMTSHQALIEGIMENPEGVTKEGMESTIGGFTQPLLSDREAYRAKEAIDEAQEKLKYYHRFQEAVYRDGYIYTAKSGEDCDGVESFGLVRFTTLVAALNFIEMYAENVSEGQGYYLCDLEEAKKYCKEWDVDFAKWEETRKQIESCPE